MCDKGQMVCRTFKIADEVDKYAGILRLTLPLVEALDVLIDQLAPQFIHHVLYGVYLFEKSKVALDIRTGTDGIQLAEFGVHRTGR